MVSNMKKIGFIGTGNMGGALISGILKSGERKVFVYDVNEAAAKKYEADGAKTCASMEELFENCDAVVLTVKPNIYKAVCQQIKNAGYNKTVITVAPGITVAKMKEMLGDIRVVRTMPNTPALIGKGVFLIAGTEQENQDVKQLLEACGSVYFLEEKQMDAGVALSGSSPAFVYELINDIADGAVTGGIPKDKALEIAAQAVIGSAMMVLETGIHPAKLIDNVCSPGGTTVVAMNKLSECGFKTAIIEAMKACTNKAAEMSKKM